MALTAQQAPVLLVGGQQLAPYAHSPQSRGVLALPGVDVTFVLGRITPEHIRSHRPSYINAVLVQSRGVRPVRRCVQCTNRLSPFPECRHVPGHFGGACANCKWRDGGRKCSFWTADKNQDRAIMDISSDDDDDLQIVPAGATAQNPIQL